MTYYGNSGTRCFYDCVIAVLSPCGYVEVADPIVLTQAGEGSDSKSAARRGAKRYMADQMKRLGLVLELVAVVPAGDNLAAAQALDNWRMALELEKNANA